MIGSVEKEDRGRLRRFSGLVEASVVERSPELETLQRREAKARHHRFITVRVLKGDASRLSGGRLTEEAREGRRLVVGVRARHAGAESEFVTELHLARQPESPANAQPRGAVGGRHDELVDERADGRQVQVRVVKGVEATQGGHDDAAADGELRAHLPLDVSLLHVNLARAELVLDLGVENDVLFFREHRRDAQDEARVLEGRRAPAVGALAYRRLAKLKVAVAADGDAVGSQKVPRAGKIAALRFGRDGETRTLRRGGGLRRTCHLSLW